MFERNKIQESTKVVRPGNIPPILQNNEDDLIDTESFGLNAFLDKIDVEHSEEFKKATDEIDEILAGLESTNYYRPKPSVHYL